MSLAFYYPKNPSVVSQGQLDRPAHAQSPFRIHAFSLPPFSCIYSAARTRFGVRVLTSVPSIPLGSILQGIKKHPISLLSKNQASMHRAAHDNVAHALFINTLFGAGEEERVGVLGLRTTLLSLVSHVPAAGGDSWIGGASLDGVIGCEAGCGVLWEVWEEEEGKNQGRRLRGIWGTVVKDLCVYWFKRVDSVFSFNIQ